MIISIKKNLCFFLFMFLIFGSILFIDFSMKYDKNNYIKFKYKFYILFYLQLQDVD